jgi:hypothetical protein
MMNGSHTISGDRAATSLLRPISTRFLCRICVGLVLGSAGPLPHAFAQGGGSCKSSGGLRFIGTTTDQSKSVWLSGTIAGSYRLEAAQGNQTVDSWDISRPRGLHISTSPFVSSGNGGVHRLFDVGGNKDCLVDTQNQKGGFTIPPNILLPPAVTLPGHVLPPPGSFFPDFVTPMLPVRPRPPIAILPPSLPPTGITPTLPVRPRPPIATLPPSGITPSLPGGIQPPIATLPPSLPPSGITPAPPDATRPQRQIDGVRTTRVAQPLNCVDPRERRPRRGEVICPGTGLSATPDPGTPGFDVPLTPGRDLGVQTLWNVWAQANYVGASDRRYGLDLKSRAGSLAFGLDRRLHDDVVFGVLASLQDSRSEGFGDTLRVDTTGFSIGPYVAVRLSRHWAMDATLTYGQVKNEVRLAILNGSYRPEIYSGSFTLHGQYDVAGFFLRPKAALYYSHVRNPNYDMAGAVLGFPINVGFPASRFNAGIFEPSGEVSRIVALPGDVYVMPYVEVGARYEFDRPNGGAMWAGDLSSVVPSPWSGFVRPGLRMSVAYSVLIELAGGYLSLGRNDLDIWEARFRVSYGF